MSFGQVLENAAEKSANVVKNAKKWQPMAPWAAMGAAHGDNFLT